MPQPQNPQSLRQDPQVQQAKRWLHQVQNSGNSQQALQQLLMQNPNVSNIWSLLKSNGGSLESVARIIAQQRGFNLNEVIQELQSEL